MTVPGIELAAGYLVKRVQHSFRRHSDAALQAVGVSMAQYAVLRALADHPDASAAELARLCFVTRQSLQDVLGGLRAAELVVAADGPPRGRARGLRLSVLGKRRLEVSHAAVVDVESAMMQGISTSAREELSRLLTACALNLESREL